MLREDSGASLLAALVVLIAVWQAPLLASEPAAGEIAVTVKGIACPFCAYGVEKHLEQIEGVSDVRIDVGKSQAVLTLEEGAAPSDDEIREAIRRAGFSTGEIRRGAERAADAEEIQKRARQADLRVEGRRCQYCALNIENTLQQTEGVISADVDFDAERATVRYDADEITSDEIARTIERLGKFQVELVR